MAERFHFSESKHPSTGPLHNKPPSFSQRYFGKDRERLHSKVMTHPDLNEKKNGFNGKLFLSGQPHKSGGVLGVVWFQQKGRILLAIKGSTRNMNLRTCIVILPTQTMHYSTTREICQNNHTFIYIV